MGSLLFIRHIYRRNRIICYLCPGFPATIPQSLFCIFNNKLFAKGINKVAQKVGEEAVEVVIEAKDNNDELFLNESADLLFHYLLLLQAKGFTLKEVVSILEKRH